MKTPMDVAALLGAVQREFKNEDRDGTRMGVVVATRVYPAAPQAVWDALTRPERVERWFLPLEGDLKVGGRYQLVGNAGGIIESCEPPKRLAMTWEMRGDASWVEVTLTPEGDNTRLVLEHAADVPEEFMLQYGPGAVGVGWELTLLGLGLYLDADDPDGDIRTEGTEWAMSAEGKAFVKQASEAWGEAWIASGIDPEVGKKAIAATSAFYTGE